MRLPAALAALATSLLLAGCAGYHLGPSNGTAAGSRSVRVQPFVNETMEPRLSEAVTSSLRRALQQDGTFRLETQDSGDVVVTGVITDFKRSEIGLQPDDVLTVRDYALELFARVTAVDRSTGHTNLNRLVSGRTSIRVGNDLSSAERQAVPLLAADLARNITSLLADGTW
jgi:hypothetical protein